MKLFLILRDVDVKVLEWFRELLCGSGYYPRRIYVGSGVDGELVRRVFKSEFVDLDEEVDMYVYYDFEGLDNAGYGWVKYVVSRDNMVLIGIESGQIRFIITGSSSPRLG